MIIGKRILFGFGTVLVSGNYFNQTLSIENILPPKEVGEEIRDNDSYEVVEKIVFKYEADMLDFYKRLNVATEEHTILHFRGHIFDFTNYNKKSVKTLINKLSYVINGNKMWLAC